MPCNTNLFCGYARAYTAMIQKVKTMASSQISNQELRERILALIEGEDDLVAKMATVVCEVFHEREGFDWVGFYRVTAPEMLKIGPYQGGHGCLQIPFERGVCGAAARTGQTQRVDDVDAFPGHIACSSSTQSELVVPCFDAQGILIGVFDIDSDQPSFFTADDQTYYEDLMAEVFSS